MIILLLFNLMALSFYGNNIIIKYIELLKTPQGIEINPIRENLWEIPLTDYKVLNNAKTLKSLDVLQDKKTKKYIILKDMAILCVYIPWRYGRNLDPTSTQMMEYFIKIALKRSYNKFIIQMINVSDDVKYKIGFNNLNILLKISQDLIKNLMEQNGAENIVSMINKIILLKGEIVQKSEIQEITDVYGGFFLLATKVDNDHMIMVE